MDQRILVTTGVSGMGRELARPFGASGAQVFVCDIDANALDALKGEVPGVLTGLCDVSKPDDIGRMVRDSTAALGGPDAMANNAGISGPTQLVEKFDPDRWQTALPRRRPDVSSPWPMCREICDVCHSA